MKTSPLTAGFLLALITVASGALAEGDPVKGEKVFRKCKACHMVGPEARNRTGPPLNGIVGATPAAQDFNYSDAMREFAAGGAVWDEATLDIYLVKPRDAVPRTKMSFAGLKKEEERADVIAYLKAQE
ncbi:MAG: c-type cytochrome [Pikeienuella sp.]